MEGPLGVEPSLAEPQSAVPPQHFGPKNLVRQGGVEPPLVGYQPTRLPLTYWRMEGETGSAPAISSLATRRLATRLLPRKDWLPRQESNLQHAASKVALRTDTECVAVVRRCGIEPLIPRAPVLQTGSDPTLKPPHEVWWIRRALLSLPPACKAGALLIELRTQEDWWTQAVPPRRLPIANRPLY